MCIFFSGNRLNDDKANKLIEAMKEMPDVEIKYFRIIFGL